jgi:hypothetical protein
MGRGPFQFIQTKVGMALIGAILIGGTCAVLAARTVNEPSVLQTSNALTANSNSTTGGQLAASTSTSNAAQATATAQATAGNGDQPTPTTHVIPPTRVPTPTPYVGQTLTYGGTVSNINAVTSNSGTFVVTSRTSGQTHTIDVTSGTQFTLNGVASSFSALQAGSEAHATCTVQADRSCLASRVSFDN